MSCATTCLSELQKAFELKKRSVSVFEIDIDALIDSSGFIEISCGAVLTLDRARALVREKSNKDSTRRDTRKLKAIQLKLTRSHRERKAHVDIDRVESVRWKNREGLSRMSVPAIHFSVCPMAEQRAISKLRRSLRSKK